MEKKEFIFPMNYKNKEKFLGFIDYKIIVAIAVFSLLVLGVLKNVEISLTAKVIIFILFVGFFSIFIIVGVNGENMLDFLWFMTKYLVREKIYVYRKTENKGGGKICKSLLKEYFQ